MKLNQKVRHLPAQHTRALATLESVNKVDRTIEVVWTTGVRGLRRGWDGPFYEELSLDPAHVDLTRLKANASVLDSHNSWAGLRAILGNVVDAWIVSPTEARAKLSLSDRSEVKGITDDILDGKIRNVSVGYSISKLVEVGREGDIPVLRAEGWQPFELSFVAVPFDAGAQSRSNDDPTNECIVITTQRDENMLTEAEKEAKRLAEKTAQENAVREAGESAAAKTRTEEADRLRGISSIIEKHGLDNSIATRCFTEGKDLNQTREFVLDHIAELNKKSGTRSVATAGDQDEHTTAYRAMEANLLVRAAPEHNQPTELSNIYRASTLLDLAKETCRLRGIDVRGRSKNEIAAIAMQRDTRGFNTTGDFPLILGNTVKKVLRDAFTTAPSDYAWMTRKITVSDYKSISRFGLSQGPALLEVKEHGEYQRGSFAENAEAMKISKFGRIVGITREVIVNDDIGAFTDIPRQWGFGAQQLIAKLVWNTILTNPLMADGLPVFHATHGNLLTASGLDLTNLEVAVALLESQTGFSAPGEDIQYLNTQAKYLVVGPALKYLAKRLTTSVDAVINSSVNIFSDLIVKSDPRITGSQWYVTADPSYIDAIGLLEMSGESGPQTDERIGFDVDGIEYKVRLDTGAKMLDTKWIVKNPGV